MRSMVALTGATLNSEERASIEIFVASLRERLGEELRAVWLYGSRARGEEPGEYSDVDLLVITDGGRDRDSSEVNRLAWEAATAGGMSPPLLAPHVMSPGRLANRREIKSFFIQEVDRDKIVLHGEL